MRRSPLHPAREVSPAVADRWPLSYVHEGGASVPAVELSPGFSAPESPLPDRLAPPAPAHEKRRPLFHPRRGWIRRFERWLSQRIGEHVYPRVPGMWIPYTRVLRKGLTLSEVEIPLAGMPPALSGTTVLFISDIHAGPFVRPRTLRATFRKLSRLRPDLILLGGDLMTTSLAELDHNAEAFRVLEAPLGVHAVLGNHDHYASSPEPIRERLESWGISLLHNRGCRIGRDGARLSLAGVDDLLMGAPEIDAALADLPGPVVLMSHNPDLFFEAARRGVDLTLSGHTHAGQIRVPGAPVLVRQSRYRLDEGRYAIGKSQLIVSRGLGAVGIPWRFACPPEAVWITLRSGPSPGDSG